MFVIQHNLQRKKTLHYHTKLLKVLRAILERIQVNQDSMSRATMLRVEDVEDSDSDYELFKRRMGMRNYFKELKMNMQRIAKAKAERSKVGKEEKKAKSPKKGGENTTGSGKGGGIAGKKKKK